jgi:hypothetical protein
MLWVEEGRNVMMEKEEKAGGGGSSSGGGGEWDFVGGVFEVDGWGG